MSAQRTPDMVPTPSIMPDRDTVPAPRLLATRVRRHLGWLRTEGVRRLIEEDELDPVARTRAWSRRRRWARKRGGPPGSAVPVWVAGVQRSGTNLLVRSLAVSPSVRVYGESDRRAFRRFRLRSDDVLRGLVRTSPFRAVVFKPLCDAHRVAELLGMDGLASGRAVWVYRSVDARAASAVAKFGDANRRALAEIARGAGAGLWQAEGLSAESIALIRSLDVEALTPLSAAALFWCVRNALLFDQGLDDRDDVAVLSYESFRADPEARIRELWRFIGTEDAPDSTRIPARIRRPRGAERVSIDERVRVACDAMTERLRDAEARAAARLAR